VPSGGYAGYLVNHNHLATAADLTGSGLENNGLLFLFAG